MSRPDPEIARLLRRADPPAATGPADDLWPRMQQRLDHHPGFRLHWFDRVAIVLASVGVVFFPRVAIQVLYYL
ncbi:MAG: hypothetical protein NTY38_13870 [Acidobacteria bacterium]|nr:hypothetical protein [Acidobacteriota bacterium]